jgi:histidinol-phosphatase
LRSDLKIQFTLDADLALAHRLADAAAVVSRGYFRTRLRRWSKEDGSLATEADLAVEDEIRSLLDVARPGDAVLGEERGATGTGPRRWIVDGIDGTVAFDAGRPDWGTLIALEVDGQVVVGLCDQPAHERRYWAAKGGGAFRTDAPGAAAQPIHVSGSRDLHDACGYLPPAPWVPTEQGRQVVDGLAARLRSASSDQSDHPALRVAAGGLDLAVFLMAGPWDLAAPALVVEEAGGRFTDAAGRRTLTGGTAVFSNGRLHDAVLQVTAPPAGDSRASDA